MLKLFGRTCTINDNELTIVIGKDKDILRNMIYYIPWIEDFNMHNFRKADFAINVNDDEFLSCFDNKNTMPTFQGGIKPYQVSSIIIVEDLISYDFLRSFHNLESLYLENTYNLKDISFIEGMINLNYLSINGSKVDSIDSIIKLIKNQLNFIEEVKGEDYYYGTHLLSHLAITNSNISDISKFANVDLQLFELVLSRNRIENANAIIGKNINNIDLSNNLIKDVKEIVSSRSSENNRSMVSSNLLILSNNPIETIFTEKQLEEISKHCRLILPKNCYDKASIS